VSSVGSFTDQFIAEYICEQHHSNIVRALMTQKRTTSFLIVGIILSIVAFCLYPVLLNDWVNWDDPLYVLGNPLVHELNGDSFRAAFTTPEVVGLYHPLTILSLAVDYHFWAQDAFGFHLTNLIFHLFNTAFVFLLFRKLKAPLIVAGLVALLFGMHPMHVESVAWISARKDVLYLFFFLLSLIFYIKGISSERTKPFLWMGVSLFAFTCSLLAKNIAFTLPFVLLLIDYLLQRKFSWKALLVKSPFFLLAIAAMFLAKSGQLESNSMDSLSTISYDQSIFFGMYNTVVYLFKSIVPIQLAAFHPFPANGTPVLIHYLAVLPFLGVLFALLWSFRHARKVFFGLALFLITIAPLLQVIPFGKAINSERYTYLPYIGLFYLIALLVEKLIRSDKKGLRYLTIAATSIWILLLTVQTRHQSTAWENSETLWTQVIDQYPDSQWAYMSRGLYFAKKGEMSEAMDDLNTSIQIEPFAQSLYERGILLERGNPDAALRDYYHSIEIDPTYARSHVNIGVLLARRNELDQAIKSFETAIHHDPEYSMAYFNCATALKIRGDQEAALDYYSKAISLEPKNVQYLIFRGVLLIDMGEFRQAIKDFSAAIKLDPKHKDAYYLRSACYKQLNQLDKALSDANNAKKYGYPIEDAYLQELAK